MPVVETPVGLGRDLPLPRRRARRTEGGGRYAVRFGVTALLLIAGTLVLVLVILPERYVLRPGFRESGVNFPNPTTPFAPLPAVTVAARPLPRPPAIVLASPAEALWEEVLPSLEVGDYAAALPVFDRYLLDHPNDPDVRRERVATLVAAGRPDEAIPELRRLLDVTDDRDDRLTLARMLRDIGRLDEAAAEYARLAAARPADLDLALERARAFAWERRYAEAASVLEGALALSPESATLRVELARIYYQSGRLFDARAVLAAVDERALADASGTQLRDDVEAALYVPPVPPAAQLTLLEQAVAAREVDDFTRARALFEEALRESPDDVTVWQAYADLLEYELGDVDGALAALLEVERRSLPEASAAADLQYRIAQLEIWTGRNAEAEGRLAALLSALEAGVASGASSAADVQALLGDLRRWNGDRVGAADRYALALASEPANARARAGLSALDAEVARSIFAIERPRMGGLAYSLTDSDDFARVDLGGEWVDAGGRWVWGGSAGSRWVSGLGLDAAPARRSGAFVELEGARWWRWGTVRTGLDFGAERLGHAWQLALGASLSLRGTGTTELRLDHGPAYPVALTLQSAITGVEQQRAALTHVRPLGGRWRATAHLEGARLVADADSVAPGSATSTHRIQAAVDVGHSLTSALTVGATTRSVLLTGAAPRTQLPGGASQRLFWDPKLVVAGGPYAQLELDLTRDWAAAARIAPGLALITEQGAERSEVVPHLAAEAGLRREAGRISAALDLFYSQSQFDGYRSYGARLTVSALGVGGSAGGP